VIQVVKHLPRKHEVLSLRREAAGVGGEGGRERERRGREGRREERKEGRNEGK
jgi:hypothetical protein